MTEGENNRSSNITIFNGCRDCNLDCMHVSEMRCDVIFSVSPRINHGGTKRRRMNSSKGYSVEPKSRKIALKSYNLFILGKYGQRYIERAFTCSGKRKPNSNNVPSLNSVSHCPAIKKIEVNTVTVKLHGRDALNALVPSCKNTAGYLNYLIFAIRDN